MSNTNNNFCDEIAMNLLKWMNSAVDEQTRLEYLKAFNSLSVQNCNKKNKPIMVDASTQTEDNDYENEPEPLVKTTKKPILFEEEEVEEETPEQEENKGELVPAQINGIIDSLRPLRDIRTEEIKNSNLSDAIRMVAKNHNDLAGIKSLTNDSKKKNINLRDLAVKLYRFKNGEDNSDYIRELIETFFKNSKYSQVTADRFLSSVVKPAIIQAYNPPELYMSKFYDKTEVRERGKNYDKESAIKVENKDLDTYDYNSIRSQIMKLCDDNKSDSWKATACYLIMCSCVRIEEILFSASFHKSPNGDNFIRITSAVKKRGNSMTREVPLINISFEKFKERFYILRLALTDSYKKNVIDDKMNIGVWIKRKTKEIDDYIKKIFPSLSTHKFRKIGASYIMKKAESQNKNIFSVFKNALGHNDYNTMVRYIVNLTNYDNIEMDEHIFNPEIVEQFITINKTKNGYNTKSLESAKICWPLLLNYDNTTEQIYDGGNFRKWVSSSAMRNNILSGKFTEMYNTMIVKTSANYKQDIEISNDNDSDNDIGLTVEETTEEEPEVEVINID